jgi:glutamate synthase (NADPH/NADH) small chain
MRARHLDIPRRDLRGVELAMPFLTQQNHRVAGLEVTDEPILGTGKNVVIIGGGDTAADRLGTCHRQGAKSVLQPDYNPRPPEYSNPETPWPLWPKILLMTPAHEDGGRRDWQIKTTHFARDENGRVKELHAVRVKQYFDEAGEWQFQELVGPELVFSCELAVVAIGFSGPEPVLPKALGLAMTVSGAIRSDRNYMTSRPGAFAAGDCRRGSRLWSGPSPRVGRQHDTSMNT